MTGMRSAGGVAYGTGFLIVTLIDGDAAVRIAGVGAGVGRRHLDTPPPAT
jgi:hypothetical protein